MQAYTYAYAPGSHYPRLTVASQKKGRLHKICRYVSITVFKYLYRHILVWFKCFVKVNFII